MMPVDLVARTFKVSDKAALFLSGGFALIAMAAVVLSWIADPNTLPIIGAVILIFAVMVMALSHMPSRLRAIIAWTIGLLFVVWFSAFIISGLLPGRTPLPPAPCIIQIWRSCDAVMREAGAAEASASSAITAKAVAAEADKLAFPPDQRARFRVIIQYNDLPKETMWAVAAGLLDSGWQVYGGERGPEKVLVADGLNEVRYGPPENRTAAEALARQLNGVKLGASDIRSRRHASIGPASLELWVSR